MNQRQLFIHLAALNNRLSVILFGRGANLAEDVAVLLRKASFAPLKVAPRRIAPAAEPRAIVEKALGQQYAAEEASRLTNPHRLTDHQLMLARDKSIHRSVVANHLRISPLMVAKIRSGRV